MSDISVVSTNPTEALSEPFFAAFDRLKGEIRQVPLPETVHINIDIPTAVTTTLGTMPELSALRPLVIAEMPQFDIRHLDYLEQYALAAGYAHSFWAVASAPMDDIDKLAQEATTVRETLLKDASALAQRHLLDGKALSELKGPNGFRNLGFDLVSLAAILRQAWPNIAGKTALDRNEIENAGKLANRLLTVVGLRDQGPAIVAEAAQDRQRAFTLFVNAYDDVRRAVTYLRWHHDDIDEIAPSLYAGRSSGKRKSGTDVQPAVPATPAAPAAPVASPVTNGTASKSIGLPNSEPFIR